MGNKRIFVVDDEKQIRDLFGEAFKRAGYSVRCAESGEHALEILEKEGFQVMFLDLNMPGMDGIELCREIRKNNPMAIICAVTGYASLFELSECRSAGFDDYFIKPVSLKVLIKQAEDAFEKINRWKNR